MGLCSGNGREGQRSRFWGFGKAYRIRAQQGKLGGNNGLDGVPRTGRPAFPGRAERIAR